MGKIDWLIVEIKYKKLDCCNVSWWLKLVSWRSKFPRKFISPFPNEPHASSPSSSYKKYALFASWAPKVTNMCNFAAEQWLDNHSAVPSYNYMLSRAITRSVRGMTALRTLMHPHFSHDHTRTQFRSRLTRKPEYFSFWTTQLSACIRTGVLLKRCV